MWSYKNEYYKDNTQCDKIMSSVIGITVSVKGWCGVWLSKDERGMIIVNVISMIWWWWVWYNNDECERITPSVICWQ